MFVAVCHQLLGTSTPSCLKMVTPFSLPINAVRFSHSNKSNGEVPSVKYLSNTIPRPAPDSFSGLTVPTVLPFNADFTVAILIPPATVPLVLTGNLSLKFTPLFVQGRCTQLPPLQLDSGSAKAFHPSK